jgi:hypothetical protein
MKFCRIRLQLVLLALLALSPAASPKDMKPRLAIKISAPQSVQLGSAVPLDVTITNTSTQMVTIFTDRFSVLERSLDFDVRDSEGAPVPETKYSKALKGTDQGLGPQVVVSGHIVQTTLKPGEDIRGRAELSKLFDWKPGTYTIRATRTDFDYGNIQSQQPRPDDADLRKPEATEQRAQSVPVPTSKGVVQSNAVTITIVP